MPRATSGSDHVGQQFQVGDMPRDKVMRCMELIADKVLPYLDRS